MPVKTPAPDPPIRTVELHHVRLSSDDPAIEVVALMGVNPPIMVDGYGGWTEIPRPKRDTAVEWTGRPAAKMILEILLDNFREGTHVENRIKNLERMALPASDRTDPPTIKLDGPVPHQEKQWVIGTLEWGAAIWAQDGRRRRQEVKLTLLEKVEDARVAIKSPASKQRGKGKTKNTRIYVIKKGDTLSSIAARQLGAAKRWKEIATLNGIRDPKNIKPGQKLKIPVK